MSIETLKAKIKESQSEIFCLKKAIKFAQANLKNKIEAEDFEQAHFIVKQMGTHFELLETTEQYLADLESDLKLEEEGQGAWAGVLVQLQELHQVDMNWLIRKHEEVEFLGKKHFQQLVKQGDMTKTTLQLITMPKDQAVEVLKQDLYARLTKIKSMVTSKVGEVVSCSGITRSEDGGFNGFFVGESGSCTVTTHVAGGYNVQRLHLRTKVTVHR